MVHLTTGVRVQECPHLLHCPRRLAHLAITRRLTQCLRLRRLYRHLYCRRTQMRQFLPQTQQLLFPGMGHAICPSSKLLLSSELRRSVRILKRIPRASRHLAASKLACILDEVSVKNDFTSWARLFQFSHRCFAIPTRGSRRRSLATLVNRQLQDEAIPSTLKHPRPGSRPSGDPLRTLAKRVSSKLEEGDYRGAVRTACSEDSVAVVTEEVISELKRKHPPPHTDSHIILPPDQSISSVTVSEEGIC